MDSETESRLELEIINVVENALGNGMGADCIQDAVTCAIENAE